MFLVRHVEAVRHVATRDPRAGALLLLGSSWPLVEKLLSSTHLAASPVSLVDLAVVSLAVLVVPLDHHQDPFLPSLDAAGLSLLCPLAAASLLRWHLPVALLHPLRLSWTLVRKRREGIVIWDRCGTVQRSSSGPLWWRPPSSLFFNHFQLPDPEGLCFIRQLAKHDVAMPLLHQNLSSVSSDTLRQTRLCTFRLVPSRSTRHASWSKCVSLP